MTFANQLTSGALWLYCRHGRYGRWNKIGICIYLFGILIQVPFLATGFYTGPVVERLGGTDISWIIGLVVPGLIYYCAMKIWPDEVPEQMQDYNLNTAEVGSE